ncbi:MAG: hypothetical protein PHS84_13585 [Paludibacter sp.]|jgi:hypothetical protein|nr:hypothetical protein [Paludibacter sp.]
METIQKDSVTFDESQSMKVIREMIQVSQKRLKNDGILFILWGWYMFYTRMMSFVLQKIVYTHQIKTAIDYFGIAFTVFTLGFSIYYLIKQHSKVKTYIGISLRYVWISLLVCFSITNMIINNVNHSVNFELQHPVFMVFIALAIVITGGIIRYKPVVFGGIIFGLLALGCSYLKLNEQFLLEAIAWLVAFVIPGHILFSKRKS